MSICSLMNCTEPSHRRNRAPDGWSLWKFDIEVVVSGTACGASSGAFPCAATCASESGGPALLPPWATGACVLLHVKKFFVLEAINEYVPVTGFLFKGS